jgi:hypothetical protein
MKQNPEIRFFPIPKNLAEMSKEERAAYSASLADHLLILANDYKEKEND